MFSVRDGPRFINSYFHDASLGTSGPARRDDVVVVLKSTQPGDKRGDDNDYAGAGDIHHCRIVIISIVNALSHSVVVLRSPSRPTIVGSMRVKSAAASSERSERVSLGGSGASRDSNQGQIGHTASPANANTLSQQTHNGQQNSRTPLSVSNRWVPQAKLLRENETSSAKRCLA